MSRVLTRAELAFFAVPRTWREIEMRFGQEAKTEEFRSTIILADDEGGSGMLHYLHPKRSWVLTDAGKAHAGKNIITRELNVYPDPREMQAREEAGEAFNELFAPLLERPGLVDVVSLGGVENPVMVGIDRAVEGGEATTFVVVEKVATIDTIRMTVTVPAENVDDELARLIAEQKDDDTDT